MELEAVELLDRGGHQRVVGELDEREAAGPLGVAIRWQEYPQDLPDLGEQGLEVVLQGVIAQVADEDFGSDGTLLGVSRNDP